MSFRVVAFLTACCALGVLKSVATAQPGKPPAQPPASPAVLVLPNFPQPRGWPTITTATELAEPLGPGVLFSRWTLLTSAGPLQASIATVDLKNPYVALRVATHGGAIAGPGEGLTAMADSVGAELGINADYFDINDTGAPLSIVVEDGRILHAPDSAAAIAVTSNNQISMGPVALHLTLAFGNARIGIARINEWSQTDDVALLTPQFGSDKAFGATEAVLEPGSAAGGFRVLSVASGVLALARLSPGQIGIVARGATAAALESGLHRGDAVVLSSESQPDLSDVRYAAGGGPMLLRDGKIVADPGAPAPEETDVANPVTGAGLSADGGTLWLVVVDGRAPSRSIGLTRPQLAELFLALGATTAMAFDSGGSSEMVVRHLGEPGTDVANVPSDGRERSIADGLFVVNAASPGPPQRLLMDPSRPTPALLVGSKLQIQARAIDANDQPVALPPGVVYSVEPASAATIGGDGMLHALAPGTLRVKAAVGPIEGELDVVAVPDVASVRIVGADQSVAPGGRISLGVAAQTSEGTPIACDPAAVTWRLESGDDRLLGDGTLLAGASASRDVVSARVGSASASAVVLVGNYERMLQAAMTQGSAAGQWTFQSRPEGLPGGVAAASAPDGASALQLAYDFSTTGVTRAAYAQTSLVLPLQPIALSIDVYGDGNGEWLRGGYRTAEGNDESVTVARHVDWQGWRTIRAAIPAQAAWPITWTRFYAVEADKTATERGALWFRNFALIYAGPAP